MKKILILLILLPLISLSQNQDTVSLKQSAIISVVNWLSEVDKMNYQSSYDNADELIKNALTNKEWNKTINYARDPLGEIISRELKSSKYLTEIPGGPDGMYVMVQFETSFQNKKNSLETITAKQGKDYKWIVAGYFIR